MKRSSHVTLVLLGTTALAGCNDDRTAPPQPTPQQFSDSLALPAPRPHCDRPEDFPLPECHDPQGTPVAASHNASGGHGSSGGHGGSFLWFFHGGGSSYGPSTSAAHAYASAGAAVRAAAPAGTTSFGGFGSAGRAAASFGGGE